MEKFNAIKLLTFQYMGNLPNYPEKNNKNEQKQLLQTYKEENSLNNAIKEPRPR